MDEERITLKQTFFETFMGLGVVMVIVGILCLYFQWSLPLSQVEIARFNIAVFFWSISTMSLLFYFDYRSVEIHLPRDRLWRNVWRFLSLILFVIGILVITGKIKAFSGDNANNADVSIGLFSVSFLIFSVCYSLQKRA